MLVNGTLEGEVELLCSRCLTAYTMRVGQQINVVYEPSIVINKEEHYNLKRDELDTGFM